MRVESHLQVTLEDLIKTKQMAHYLPVSAEILDISQGGMRISTEKPFHRDTLVHLSFDTRKADAIRQDIKAQVQWCNKQIDDPGYQIGVSFQDSEIKNAMDSYLSSTFGTT